MGIETDRRLWVEALDASCYQVFPINLLAVDRYRVSGPKSDGGDAKLLAGLVGV